MQVKGAGQGSEELELCHQRSVALESETSILFNDSIKLITSEHWTTLVITGLQRQTPIEMNGKFTILIRFSSLLWILSAAFHQFTIYHWLFFQNFNDFFGSKETSKRHQINQSRNAYFPYFKLLVSRQPLQCSSSHHRESKFGEKEFFFPFWFPLQRTGPEESCSLTPVSSFSWSKG